LPAIAATLPGYESLAVYGLFAPAGTPPAIIVRLNTVIAQFLARADIQERFAAAGMDAAASTPGQLSASVQAEVARIGKVIRAAGIRGD